MLTPGQRVAISKAGAIGLALVGAGASLVWAMLAAAIVFAILRALVIDLFDDAEWGGTVVRWIEELDLAWLVLPVMTLVLLAVGLIMLGCWLSVRRMQRARVAAAVSVTIRGAALGTALQACLSACSSVALGALTLLTGVLGFWLVTIAWVVLSVASSTLIGWLAGPRTWLRLARRAVVGERAAGEGAAPAADARLDPREHGAALPPVSSSPLPPAAHRPPPTMDPRRMPPSGPTPSGSSPPR